MFEAESSGNGLIIQFESEKLEQKFKNRELKAKLNALMMNEEVQNYFEERLMKPCTEVVSRLPDSFEKVSMRETVKEVNMRYNLRMNVMYMALRKAFELWITGKCTIDEGLEKSLNVDLVKETIEILGEMMLKIIAQSVEVVRQIYSEEHVSPADYLGVSANKGKKMLN